MRRVGISGCSDGLSESFRPDLERLQNVLRSMDMEPVCAQTLFAVRDVYSAWPEERAEALMSLFRDESIAEIFDITGGDLANEVLPFLDYDAIACSRARLWGYSDLTCVLNAIYARTGKQSVLYTARNLIRSEGESQRRRFADGTLFQFGAKFLQGERMEGVVVGGNIRCLLKLAGTPYWPDMRGKILLLEGMSTGIAQASACFAQLKQLGALDGAAGILLGTFTALDRSGSDPTIEALARRWLDPQKPLARTMQIGHGADSRAVVIGGEVKLQIA